MSKEKLIAIHWLPKSYLADTELMDRATEHAYFRLLQYIYLTQDRLPDDDAKLARLLKCKSVAEWRKIKAELLQPRGIDPETGEEIPARIYIEGGKILSKKCTQKLAEASKARRQHSLAGKASAYKRGKWRKSLISKESDVTAVVTADGATVGTGVATADKAVATTAEGTNLKGLSYRKTTPISPSNSAAGTGRVPSDPPARPPKPSADQDPYSHGFVDKQNRVVVHQPDGVILKISETGAVDLIAHDREAVIPQLTTEQALELRASTLRHISEPVAKVLAAAKPESFDPIRDMPACLRRAQSLA